MRKMRTWRECLVERIATPERAIGYLQAILEDYQVYKSPSVVRRALKTVVDAQGGVNLLAKEVEMDPQVFSNLLSNNEIQLIDVIGVVLKSLGYQIVIQPIETETQIIDSYTDTLKHRSTSPHVAEEVNDEFDS